MSTKHSRHAPKQRRASVPTTPMSAIAAGLLTFFLSCALLLLMGGAICAKVTDPDPLFLPLSLTFSLLPALLAGLIAARKRGECAIPTGLLVGGILFALSFLLALLLPKGADTGLPFLRTLLLRLMIPVFSTLGALIGVNRRKSFSRKR